MELSWLPRSQTTPPPLPPQPLVLRIPMHIRVPEQINLDIGQRAGGEVEGLAQMLGEAFWHVTTKCGTRCTKPNHLSQSSQALIPRMKCEILRSLKSMHHDTRLWLLDHLGCTRHFYALVLVEDFQVR